MGFLGRTILLLIQTIMLITQHGDTPITDQRTKLVTLINLHKSGIGLQPGMDLLLERSYVSNLIPATLIDYQVKPVSNDYSGYGQYANRESFVTVEYDGKKEQWPFSMIFVAPKA